MSSTCRAVEVLQQRLGLLAGQASDLLEAMIDAGSRYINLEAHAGVGISIVLGQSYAESRWLKGLPKSGERFETVVSRLRSIGLYENYSRECCLRIQFVDWMLNRFDGASLQPTTTSLMHAGPVSNLTLTIDMASEHEYAYDWNEQPMQW